MGKPGRDWAEDDEIAVEEIPAVEQEEIPATEIGRASCRERV